jgi:hypothetical protein
MDVRYRLVEYAMIQASHAGVTLTTEVERGVRAFQQSTEIRDGVPEVVHPQQWQSEPHE